MQQALAHLVDRLARSRHRVLVHCCAADPPIALLHEAGARGVLVDLDQLTRADWDVVGAASRTGAGSGSAPCRPAARSAPDEVARRVLTPLRALGVDPDRTAQLMLTPACGLAGATRAEAVDAPSGRCAAPPRS